MFDSKCYEKQLKNAVSDLAGIWHSLNGSRCDRTDRIGFDRCSLLCTKSWLGRNENLCCIPEFRADAGTFKGME